MNASIIVPVYNAKPYLARTLPRWLEQSGAGDYEVILVNNNSTDGTFAGLPEHPRLRTLTEPDQGAYRARNAGVAAARGATLVFTDPDCLAETDWLAALLEPLAQPGIEVVMGRDRHAGDGRSIRLLSAYDHLKELWTMGQDDGALYYGHTNNMAVSRACWDAVGPFETLRRGADVIFVRRAVERFGTAAVVYRPEALVHHLEVDSATEYFRKCRIYGRSYRRYRRVVDTHALGWRQRWAVYRMTVDRKRLGPLRAARLLALLVVGVGHYSWGRWLER